MIQMNCGVYTISDTVLPIFLSPTAPFLQAFTASANVMDQRRRRCGFQFISRSPAPNIPPTADSGRIEEIVGCAKRSVLRPHPTRDSGRSKSALGLLEREVFFATGFARVPWVNSVGGSSDRRP